VQNPDSRRYGNMADHDLLTANAIKLDIMNDRLIDFINLKEDLCEKHECRMGAQDERINKIDSRVGTLETYVKVSVGTLVIAVSVFGVYVLSLIVRGG
jgi:hypothetical protein